MIFSRRNWFWFCFAVVGWLTLLALDGCQPVGGGQTFGNIDHSILNITTLGNTPTLTPTTTATIPLGGLGAAAPKSLLGDTTAPPSYTICGKCSIDGSETVSSAKPAAPAQGATRRRAAAATSAEPQRRSAVSMLRLIDMPQRRIDPELQRQMDDEWRSIWDGVAARGRAAAEATPPASPPPPEQIAPPEPPQATPAPEQRRRF